jgi:capsular polysaccharide biosynthesis protein
VATIVSQRELQAGSHSSPPRRRSSWPAHWPLSLLFLGFPLWWALGLTVLLPMVLSLVMADQLLRRRRRLVLPQGFALWAVFLVWVLIGVVVLWADAPSAIPGGGASRLAVFAYRAIWYFTATMVLLWVSNLRQQELSNRWLYQLLGFMFVVTAVGGLVGVLFPNLEFRSLVELLLPGGIRDNNLVQTMVHPKAADIEHVLGRPDARPKAPFAFSNTWGSSLALYMPFFFVAWWRDGALWQRIAVPFVLLGASVPIVYSLNRGLWICLGLGALGYVALQIRKRRLAPIVVAVALLATVTLVFFLSPLAAVFQERLAHAHSNERRGLLLTQTVASAAKGSPVVGFGSTRNVQGSFSSIAGADTPDCNACGLPPLGTQGHMWMVIFSQGLVGAALFVAFFLVAFMRSWRCRTTAEVLCTLVLVFFALQVFIYDTLGLPLLTVMLAIGAVWREQVATGERDPARHLLRDALDRLRAAVPLLLALSAVGLVAGVGVASLKQQTYSTSVSILLNDVPIHLQPTLPNKFGTTTPDSTTVDTEANLITSSDTLALAAGRTDPAAVDRLRNEVSVTAAPNTRVLFVEVRTHSAKASRRLATAVADSYLTVRRAQLSLRRDQALARITAVPSIADDTAGLAPGTTLNPLRESLADLVLTPRTAGQVLATGATKAVGRQPEVPIASGAALGFGVGALLLAARPGWTPRRRAVRKRWR